MRHVAVMDGIRAGSARRGNEAVLRRVDHAPSCMHVCVPCAREMRARVCARCIDIAAADTDTQMSRSTGARPPVSPRPKLASATVYWSPSAQGGVTQQGVVLTYLLSFVIDSH